MEALEAIVEKRLRDEDDEDGNLEELLELEDEIDCDVDSNYVPEAVPSTSSTIKGKKLPNRPQV